jgi:erythromycin esterase-like protein
MLPPREQTLRRELIPLTGAPGDYDPLVAGIGDARLVLLGQATHGTHEFYRERTRITRRLIEERGFDAVAIEADWPDAYRVNRYVQGASEDRDAEEALHGFRRFPSWMWRNAEVLDFVGWLRAHNDGRAGRPVGLFGLDLYSLYSSIQKVVEYLDGVDPEAAERARERYACFEHFGGDDRAFDRAARGRGEAGCRRKVVAQLTELQGQAASYLRRDGIAAEDEHFFAEENARLVASAEEYYRAMFVAGPSSAWNLRDRHMVETLARLWEHRERHGEAARLVVWMHNSHVGDARMTEMSGHGEESVGQLARERWGEEVRIVGFTTYTGTVAAAATWDAPAARVRLRPALPESVEDLMHSLEQPRFMLDLGRGEASRALRSSRLERAIGVIFRPESELASHYFQAHLAGQFDVVIHIDETRAVEPLERTAGWGAGDPPETYPSAL